MRKLHSRHWLPKEGYKHMINVRNKNLFKHNLAIKETNCTIITDKADTIEKAISSIVYHRTQLEAYIKNHPSFLYALKPINVDKGATIVELMASAAKKANVGPMASVAGVLADLVVEAMISSGANVAVVEDGGEISAISNRPVDVALLAGDHPLSGRLGFRLEEFPTGVATSSGVFGHALSFGEAESVTLFSESAGLADAASTAVCNVVKGRDFRKGVRRGIDEAMSIRGVNGVFIIYREITGIGGRIPSMIKIVKEENQTRLQD
jgi:ApbE superfamily uncharacterized protein (UPF0280 family)